MIDDLDAYRALIQSAMDAVWRCYGYDSATALRNAHVCVWLLGRSCCSTASSTARLAACSATTSSGGR